MGSIGSPNAWAPYDNYKDCARGTCNFYCPQWCYPPPLESSDDSGTTFSPLIIAIIGILASAFLLVSYYAIITKYCRRRRPRNPNTEVEALHDEMTHDQWQIASTGLDESLIKSITVFKYKKGDGLVEGTECSVCLNEFQENENLRLLPKCCHAFHPACIDTWLKSQSNCPLCRANAAPTNYPLPPVPAPNSQTSSSLDISAYETQRENDLVILIDERERTDHEELFVSSNSDFLPKSPLQANIGSQNSDTGNDIIGDQEGVGQFRRSISLGAFSCQRNLLVADILKIDEDGEGLKLEIHQCENGSGSSKGIQDEQIKSNMASRNSELARSPAAMRRSFSTGRFTFARQDKGKNYILPS